MVSRFAQQESSVTQALADAVRQPVLVLHDDLRVKSANGRFYQTFQLAPQETHGRFIYELDDGQWDFPALHTLLDQTLAGRPQVDDVLIEHDFQRIGRRKLLVSARRLDEQYVIVLVFSDVTEDEKGRESDRPAASASTQGDRPDQARLLRQIVNELTQAEHRERVRFAQTLHDHLQQLIFASMLKVGGMHGQVPSHLERDLEHAESLISEAIDASRSLAVELNPPVLHEQGLAAALDFLAQEQRRYGLVVSLRADVGDSALPEGIRSFIYHAVRELLLNVIKHARTKQADVDVRRTNHQLHVSVEDHGGGCAPEAIHRDSGSTAFGLAAIRRRAELWGGRFAIQCAPGRGCRVTLDVPV